MKIKTPIRSRASNGEKHKKIKKIVSLISGLFLVLQVLAGTVLLYPQEARVTKSRL